MGPPLRTEGVSHTKIQMDEQLFENVENRFQQLGIGQPKTHNATAVDHQSQADINWHKEGIGAAIAEAKSKEERMKEEEKKSVAIRDDEESEVFLSKSNCEDCAITISDDDIEDDKNEKKIPKFGSEDIRIRRHQV